MMPSPTGQKVGHVRPIIKNGKAGKDFEITLMAEISSAETDEDNL